jgi:23S rRNA U2552 (ribose-2'-O)-methylase RlmE/FtsJ
MEKQSSGALNPARFETDIVSAINGETRLSAYQSAYAKNCAEKCAKSLAKQIGAITKADQISKDSASGSSVLTPVYKRFMCGGVGRCNGDPKADVVVTSQMNGKMRISMKKQGAAQIAAAQAGEASAVISAALGVSKEMPTLVRSILSQTLSKDSYYDIRAKYGQENGGKPEDFDSMLSNLTGLKTNAATPTSQDLKKFNAFLKTIGIQDKITASLREYMTSASVRKRIFREFASGEKRFISKESDRIADWFLAWGESGTVELHEIDEFVDSHLGSFRMNIRDRGNESGGSLRVSIKDSQEFLEIRKMLYEDFDRYCLTEGVMDTTVSILRSAGSSVAALYRNFIAAVKSVLDIVAALFTDGAAALLEYFGIETTELSYTW